VIFVVISIDIRPEKRNDFLAGITRYYEVRLDSAI